MGIRSLARRILKSAEGDSSVYDLTKDEVTPCDAYYDGFSSGVLNVPVNRCRGYLLGFKANAHPFVKALKADDEDPGSGRDLLSSYYHSYQPKTMADALRIDSSKLRSYHSMQTVMPWAFSTPEERGRRFIANPNSNKPLAKEAVQHGLDPLSDYGCQFFGPVSEAHAEMEYQRLFSVYESIRKKGYKPKQGDHLHGEFLVDGDNWVWIAIGGKHRFASLVATGANVIPVAAKARWSALIIRRSEVDHWPNVKNGLFTRTEALQVFDNMISGVSMLKT